MISSLLLGVVSSAGLGSGEPGQKSAEAQAHAESGKRLLQDGDLAGAEKELRRAVELAPKESVYLGSLGAVLGIEQKLEESNSYLGRALRLNPRDTASRRNLASNQFQLGQLQPARENLERLAKDTPNDPVVRLLLGMVDEEQEDYTNAVRLLDSVPEQVRERPKSIAALARAYYNIGQRDKARETIKGLQVHPAGAEGVFLGGQVAAQANDFETAEQMFASIWSSFPDLAKLGYNLALAQYQANHIHKSQDTLSKIVKAGHETADICNLLGWCLFKQGKTKEAVAALDKAIALEPSRESNYLDVGMMLIEAHRFDGALIAAQKALDVKPGDHRAYRLKGLVETKLNRLKEAEKSYARAVELNPTDEQSILGLASAQLNDGKVRDAEATFEKGIHLLPRDAVLYEAYGGMLLWLEGATNASTESRAVSLLQTAMRLDGSQADPHYQLGKLALRQGKIQEALQELETAARLDPNNSRPHYALVSAYRRLGRRGEAEKELAIYKSLKAKEGQSLSQPLTRENEFRMPELHLAPAGISQIGQRN